jgi:hypothetical protein
VARKIANMYGKCTIATIHKKEHGQKHLEVENTIVKKVANFKSLESDFYRC